MKKIIGLLLVFSLLLSSFSVINANGANTYIENTLLEENFNDNTDDKAINVFKDGRIYFSRTYNEDGGVDITSVTGSVTVGLNNAEILSDFVLSADITLSHDGDGIIIRGDETGRSNCYFLQWYNGEFRVLKFVGTTNNNTTGLIGKTSAARADSRGVKQAIRIEALGNTVKVWLAEYDENGNLSEYIKVIDFVDDGTLDEFLTGYIGFYLNGAEHKITFDNLKIETADNGTLLYEADFTENAFTKAVYGTVNNTVANNILTVGGAQWTTGVLPDEAYTKIADVANEYDDYTIEAVVSANSGVTFLPGIAFRGTDGNVYSVYIRNMSAKAVANLMRVKNNAPSGGTVINAADGSAAQNATYSAKYGAPKFAVESKNLIKVKVSKSRVYAWFNGYPVLECSTANGLNYQALEFSKGSVGLMNTTGQADGHIHSFRVYGYKGEVLSSSLKNGLEDVPVILEKIEYTLTDAISAEDISVTENGKAFAGYTVSVENDKAVVKFQKALTPLAEYTVTIPSHSYTQSFTTGGDMFGEVVYLNTFETAPATKDIYSTGAVNFADGAANVNGTNLWATSYITETGSAVASGKVFDNYAVEVDFIPQVLSDADASAALSFRTGGVADGENDTYSVYLKNRNFTGVGKRTDMTLMSILNGTPSGGTIINPNIYYTDSANIAKYTIPTVELNKAHKLLVIVNGSRIRGYINGNLMLDYTVSGDRVFAGGGVGFMAGGNPASFDNLKIYKLNDYCVTNLAKKGVTIENLSAENVTVDGYIAGFTAGKLDFVDFDLNKIIPHSGGAQFSFADAGTDSEESKIMLWKAETLMPIMEAIEIK